MDTENEIIPLCLYSNNISSHITLPEKYWNNGISYKCNSQQDMNFITTFYTINPDLKPNPTHADLFGVKNTFQETTEIINLYDPFNVDENVSIRFLAWLEATPNTIPLHISTNGNHLYISPYKNYPANYVPYIIPVIYVLSKAEYKFSDSYGKCIPNPDGKLSLGECIVLHNKNITNPSKIGVYPDILTYLGNRYKKDEELNWDYLWVIFGILFISCLFLIKMKKRNSRKK